MLQTCARASRRARSTTTVASSSSPWTSSPAVRSKPRTRPGRPAISSSSRSTRSGPRRLPRWSMVMTNTMPSRSDNLGIKSPALLVYSQGYGLDEIRSRLHVGGDRPEREVVRGDAEAGDRAGRHASHHAGVPEALPGCGVRQVHLNEHQAGVGHLRARVTQRVGVVREGRRVEDDVGAGVDRLVQPSDQLGLVVRLPYLDVQAQGLPHGPARRRQVLVGRRAVDLRLPHPQPAEVGTVEHQHPPHVLDPSRRPSPGGAAARGWWTREDAWSRSRSADAASPFAVLAAVLPWSCSTVVCATAGSGASSSRAWPTGTPSSCGTPRAAAVPPTRPRRSGYRTTRTASRRSSTPSGWSGLP